MEAKSDESLNIVNGLISDYYRTCENLAPARIAEREFGVGTWELKIASRHLSFRSERDLKTYLSTNSTPYVSASSALYKFPAGRPMEKKGWLGSELVFDLDATDMHLPCQNVHGKSWVCKICFEEVKKEAIKLIYDFLIPDFGFDENSINVNFSGNRGYHVRVPNDEILKLDAAARREITGYISGAGIDFDDIFKFEQFGPRSKKLTGPKPSDKGWKGKIARNFVSNLNAGVDSLMKMGMEKSLATTLYRKKNLVELGINSGNWDMVYIKNKEEFWKSILERQAISQSDRIDGNVTNDPTHLLRLPNSIHGGSGLIAKKLRDARQLYSFDPMKEAIAFRKGFARIDAKTSYELNMNGQKFGPYGGEIKVPTYVAVYLYTKGLARILNLN